jgi:SAM-dependent methyltransferase
MQLSDITQRSRPAPWSEGDNIPWNEPSFSERMLKEHLNQDHDAASRRSHLIDRHVAWIHSALLAERPARVLDLGCGPGLYASRLARLGCTCTGIDFSPASIAYARETAAKEGLACQYQLEDVRLADFGGGYDLAMFIYGEFNVFKPQDARAILQKMHAALNQNGTLLLEVSPLDSIESIGRCASAWSAQPTGLFSSQPHLLLDESFWDAAIQTATTRYYVVDAVSGQVSRHAASYRGYTQDELADLLAGCGFEKIRFYPALGVEQSALPSDFIAITAHKK